MLRVSVLSRFASMVVGLWCLVGCEGVIVGEVRVTESGWTDAGVTQDPDCGFEPVDLDAGIDDAGIGDAGIDDAGIDDAGIGGGRFPPLTSSSQLRWHAQANMPLPGYLQSYTDPVTGNQVKRITDKATFDSITGRSLQYLGHSYAKTQPWTSDGRQMVLGNSGYANGVVLDAKTHIATHRYHIPANGLLANNPSTPRFIYGLTYSYSGPTVIGTQFVRGDIEDDRSAESGVSAPANGTGMLFDFGGLGYSLVSIGSGEGQSSNDDRRWAFIARRPTGVDVVCFDASLRAVSGTFHGDGLAFDDIDTAVVSQSGNYVVVLARVPIAGHPAGVLLLDSQCQFIRSLSTNAMDVNHGDSCVLANGDEAWVHVVGRGPLIDSYPESIRYSDGRVRPEGEAATYAGVFYVSCRNVQRPGYAYVSTVQNSNDAVNRFAIVGTKPLWNHVWAVRLDGSGDAEQWAQLHHTEVAGPFSYNYEASPWACPSPDGERVAFRSVWGDPASTAIANDFEVTVP